MPYFSPLRYPGGKKRLIPVVSRLIDEARLRDIQYAEPYAGGASIALALLLDERAADIHINDLSRSVFAFWHQVLHGTTDLCQRIATVPLSMGEWKKQRAIYKNSADASLDELGFATLFLNRTNRSGIIAGGVIGGKNQTGEWKIDARFNKSELIQRVKRVGRYRSRIHLYQQDALQFTNSTVQHLGPRSFSFYDPPYIENGDGLYLNEYDIEGHRQIAVRVAQLNQPWVVTYDHAAVQANLYPAHRRLTYGLNYTAQGRYKGREVMFFSDNLSIPSEWLGSTRCEIARPSDNVAIYGRMENVKAHAEMGEGPTALERFQKAMRTIVSVPKGALPARRTSPAKKSKKSARRKP